MHVAQAVAAPRPARSPRGEARRVRRLGDAPGVPDRGAQGARRGPRRRRHLRRQPPRQARGARPGRSGVPQPLPEQRPRPDRPGPGAVHAGLRRGDRRRRRRPDRLLPRRRRRAAGAQRGQLGRGRAAAGGRVAPSGITITDHHETHAVLAVQGPKSDEVLQAVGLPVGHDYMSFEEAPVRGPRRRGLPHRLHRRARLRADRRQRRGSGAVGRAAGGGRAARDPALRPRRPRHAAHRDGLPAARAGHQPRRHPQPGPARLGRRLVQARVLGQGGARRGEGGRRPGSRCGGWWRRVAGSPARR